MNDAIQFYITGDNSTEIMRIARDGIWVNPDIPVDEAAKAVLDALSHQVQVLVQKSVEGERDACVAVCCDMIDAEYKTGKVDHNEMAWTQACAAAIRARSLK